MKKFLAVLLASMMLLSLSASAMADGSALVSWYTFGMPGSARFRNEINQMTDMDTLKEACGKIMLPPSVDT